MRLYTTPDLERFFLVPSGVTLPPGGDPVETVLGETVRCNLVAMAVFEVTGAEARAWSKGQRARDDEAHAARQVQSVERQKVLAAELERDFDALARQLGYPDVKAALRGAGLHVDSLLADPEAAAGLWAEVMASVALAVDPARRPVALERIRAALVRHGHPEAAENLRRAPELLQPWMDRLLARVPKPPDA